MSKGIDIPIDAQKTIFTTYLWATASRLLYGRAMRNYREDKLWPEAMTVSSTEYTDVQLDDRYDVISFFDVLPTRSPDEATVDIYFAVKLTKLSPAIIERATEYALSAAVARIKQSGYFTVEEIVDGYESWSQWAGVKREDNMQPFYLFRIRTKSNYTLTC